MNCGGEGAAFVISSQRGQESSGETGEQPGRSKWGWIRYDRVAGSYLNVGICRATAERTVLTQQCSGPQQINRNLDWPPLSPGGGPSTAAWGGRQVP